MGIASLILGIIGIVISWIPIIGLISFVLVIIGLILGIIDVSKKTKTKEKKGVGIAGIVVCSVAIPIIVFMTITTIGTLIFLIAGDGILDSTIEMQQQLNETSYYEDVSLNEYYESYYNILDSYDYGI